MLKITTTYFRQVDDIKECMKFSLMLQFVTFHYTGKYTGVCEITATGVAVETLIWYCNDKYPELLPENLRKK